MDQPKLERIKSVWSAIGNGWAAHGRTQEEALRFFKQAQERHARIAEKALLEKHCAAENTRFRILCIRNGSYD